MVFLLFHFFGTEQIIAPFWGAEASIFPSHRKPGCRGGFALPSIFIAKAMEKVNIESVPYPPSFFGKDS